MTKAILHAPIGPVLLDCDGSTLRSVRILGTGQEVPDGYGAPAAGSPAAEAARQIHAYFDEGFTDFDLPLEPAASPRGEVLRAAIAVIPPGETLSYGALARVLGSSPRAIGQLCARNPFPIVVPCHRVLAEGGRLGNFSGGEGPKTKSWLLEHERRHSGGTLL